MPQSTRQGGIISPLLANIALHGIEAALGIYRYAQGTLKKGIRRRVICYADDFVVFCKSPAEAEQTLIDLRRANYYRGVVSSELFHKLDSDIFWKLRRWISKTHPNKSFSWRDRRYWANHPAYPDSQWSFVDQDTGMVLYHIGYTRIQRHVLIQGQPG